MTVKIAGFWERGWDTPWQEFNWWIHPIKEFGVTEFSMSPVTGIEKSTVSEYSDLATVIDAADADSRVCVYLDEAATTELADFVHPENALYIVGRTGYSPYVTNFREGTDQAVKIPTVNNNGGFWGHQAVTMILYDRFLKGM